MGQRRRVSRRTVLGAAGGLAAAGPLAAVAGPVTAASAAATLRPISMAMHIHASFSEGSASFEAHLAQARRHGVDVIWWTDHDFRVAAHDHRRLVQFNGASEPEGQLAWNWASSTEGALAASAADFVTRDDGQALRLNATAAGAGRATLWYAGTAWNYTYGTSIADTTLELDVRTEQSGANAVLVLAVDLSYHPARAGRPAGIYKLRYEIGGVTARRTRADGIAGVVELPAAASADFQRFTFDLATDVAALWPDLVAGDNALRNLRLAVAVSGGATGRFTVDRLVFNRSRRLGQAGEDLRASVLDRYRDEYPDVTHHRAYEVSLVRHLNWYGGDQLLPAFPSPPLRDNDPALTRSMVDFLHSHGGIVCWNHPLDVEKRDSLAKLMIERNKLGADLVEIGRQPQADLLWVYDVAARNALFFTAVGSSDDHDGVNWLAAGAEKEAERYLTYVWAPSTQRADLVAALRKGSAWFTDPARYRGSLDIRLGSSSYLGAVVVTRASTVTVTLVATALPKSSVLEIVTGKADLAGTGRLQPATTVQKVAATSVKYGKYTVKVKPTGGIYVRTQVRLAGGELAAVSNPLWLLPKAPPRGIPADRKRSLPG